jgi:hypothetical protein
LAPIDLYVAWPEDKIISINEKPITTLSIGFRGEVALLMLVDIAHDCSMSYPVVLGILKNAESFISEILYTNAFRDIDYIFEDIRQVLHKNGHLEFCKKNIREEQTRWRFPMVAESSIAGLRGHS